MTDVQQNNRSNKPRDIKNESTPNEDEKMEKLLVEEKQPEDKLPVGEGHETEVIEENKE